MASQPFIHQPLGWLAQIGSLSLVAALAGSNPSGPDGIQPNRTRIQSNEQIVFSRWRALVLR